MYGTRTLELNESRSHPGRYDVVELVPDIRYSVVCTPTRHSRIISQWPTRGQAERSLKGIARKYGLTLETICERLWRAEPTDESIAAAYERARIALPA